MNVFNAWPIFCLKQGLFNSGLFTCRLQLAIGAPDVPVQLVEVEYGHCCC